MSGSAVLERPAARRAASVLNDPAAAARRAAGLPLLKSEVGEPTWEVAERLYPRQGAWTEAEYLKLLPKLPGRVEFVAGALEFLPMPTYVHERILKAFRRLLEHAFEATGSGEVFQNGLLCRTFHDHPTGDDHDRLPDHVVVRPDAPPRDGYPLAEDILLLGEVVSPDRRSVARDHIEKRAEYAAAGVPEYWIVDPTDPADPFVLVLTLPDGASEYVEHGTFRPGATAASPSLPALTCDVAALFAAAEA